MHGCQIGLLEDAEDAEDMLYAEEELCIAQITQDMANMARAEDDNAFLVKSIKKRKNIE